MDDIRGAVWSVLQETRQNPGDILHDLTVDAYAGGASVSRQYAPVAKALDVGAGLIDIDWSEWEPGDSGTAADLLAGETDAARLHQLLSEAGVRIKSIQDTRLDDLASAIADSIDRGTTVKALADQIVGLLTNPDRAEMIAQTETTRVMGAAARDTYDALGVTWIMFLTAEDVTVCADCASNEDQGPIPAGGTFGEGDPPVHPLCRCTLIPASGPDD